MGTLRIKGHLHYKDLLFMAAYIKWPLIPRDPIYIFDILGHQVSMIHTQIQWRKTFLTHMSLKAGVLREFSPGVPTREK